MLSSTYYDIILNFNNLTVQSNQIILHRLDIIESLATSIPTIELEFTATDAFYNALVSTDKLKGSIQITEKSQSSSAGTSSDIISKLPFVIFKSKIQSVGDNHARLKVLAVYDWDYALNAHTEFYESTSAQVFNKVGLTTLASKSVFYSTSTDSQVWINPTKRGINFLNDVASHAYYDDSSVFLWGLRANGTLIFRDISRDNTALTKYASLNGDYSKSSQSTIPFVQYMINTDTGIYNSVFGYGRNFTQYIYDTNEFKDDSKITMTIGQGARTISEVNAKTQGSYHLPIDLGNTHQYYTRAKIQNLRIKSMYSDTVNLLFDGYPDIHLLDTLSVVAQADNIPTLIDNSRGIVSSKRVTLTDQRIVTNIEFNTNLLPNFNL